LFAVSAALGAVIFAACGDDDAVTAVQVTLNEWEVSPNRASAPAGDITFELTNEGPDHEHEMLIIRTDFGPGELPEDEDGRVDLEADGVNVIGKISKFEPGRRSSGTFTLSAGNYVLLCNLHGEHEGEDVSHYQQGMRVAFTAEE
jgi:hypothetical protein